ncbi:hypothetical protein JW879_06370 [candidate division WOR-3 bacterium]|nr:hypothetical protein [candidate division WOR-3 bacterium]
MILFILSFHYYTNVYHSIYNYDETSYAVTNYLINTSGVYGKADVLFMKYKEDFGVKRFQYIYDSLSIGENNKLYHVVLGDMAYLRGVEVGYNSPYRNFSLNVRAGKMRDLMARVFPTFERNDFFSEIELFIVNHKFTLNSRWDRDRTSTLLGDEFSFNLGNLKLSNDINLGYVENPRFAINEELFYGLGSLYLRSFLRFYSSGFVTREGIEYTNGRFNWGINPSYKFPIGLNVFSGFYQTGRLDRPLQNQVLDGFSYRFPFNLSVNFTNNLNWGSDRDSGYRNYLSLYYFLYNKGRLSFRYQNSYYNRRNESFELEGIINLQHSNLLEAAVSKSGIYGWEYSLGTVLRMGSSIHGDFRLRHMTEQEKLSYNASLSFDTRGGFSSRFGISGNTATESSRVYTIELTKRGSIEKVGFGTISGVVWHDENGDGRKQKGEPPLKDIKIILDGKKKIDVNRIGEYRIGPIPKGEHSVELEIKGVPAFLGRDSLKKKIKTGFVDFKTLNFPVFSLSSISGVVYYDKNHNLKRDHGEEGVPNVKVSIIRGDYSKHTYTNFFGEYSIQNIVPGDYTVKASRFPPGYDLSPKDFFLYVQLTGGMKKEGIIFGIAKPVKKIERKEF